MDKIERIEDIVMEILDIFEVRNPPIPVEPMIQHTKTGLWEEVDIMQLSGSFLMLKHRYSPRMSVARLLARHILMSEWGRERNLDEILKDEEDIALFARILVMPSMMVKELSSGAMNPQTMSIHFEVPDDEARIRLEELS